MESLPSEIVNEILLLVDRPSLYYAAQVCNLWRRVALTQVKIAKKERDFYKLCKAGDRLSVIKNNVTWLNYGLAGASRGGHKDLIELMILRGANSLDWSLENICRGGHKELIELIIEKGANNWNEGLYGACRGGHIKLGKFNDY